MRLEAPKFGIGSKVQVRLHLREAANKASVHPDALRRTPSSECAWMLVEAAGDRPKEWVGRLQSQPVVIKGLHEGDTIRFMTDDVIAVSSVVSRAVRAVVGFLFGIK